MQKAMGVRELIQGLGIVNKDHLVLYRFLIKTKDDFAKFMQEFYTGQTMEDIVSYQQYKRQMDKLSLDEFIKLYQTNKKEALEELLQEPISVDEVDFMDVYDVSLTKLYRKLEKNSNRSYLAMVKETYELPDNFSDDFLLTT